MSYFNSEQEDYMRSLEATDPAKRCWCGWYGLRSCPNCKTNRSCQDKLNERCPECHNDGGPERMPIIHRKGCSSEGSTHLTPTPKSATL